MRARAKALLWRGRPAAHVAAGKITIAASTAAAITTRARAREIDRRSASKWLGVTLEMRIGWVEHIRCRSRRNHDACARCGAASVDLLGARLRAVSERIPDAVAQDRGHRIEI